MDALFVIGLGVYMSGHGLRGFPNGGMIGSALMVAGGVIAILSLVVA